MTAQVIPYAKLYVAPENARASSKTERDIDRLALSIATLDLIQPLSVYPDGERFAVVDGGGRLAALLKLKKAKKLPADLRDGVPCIVAASPDLARARSIAANEVREAMGPADTILAYKAAFEEEGQTVEQIAAACGVTAVRVRRLLRYKDVAPEILAALKAGEITLDVVQAFTLTDDPATQSAVWAALTEGGRTPTRWQVTERLQDGLLRPHSALARFVGVEAYEAAGGRRLVDLFNHDDPSDAGWLDVGLAQRLADEKLLAAGAAIQEAEGWGRVMLGDARELGLRRMAPEGPRLTDDEAELMDLCADMVNEDAGTPWELAAAELVYDALEARANGDWTDDQKASGVVCVTLGHGGALDVSRGWTDAEERQDAKEASTASPAPARAKDEANEGWGHAGHDDLTRIASTALRVGLLERPQAALDALVAHLAVQVLYGVRAGALTPRTGWVEAPKGQEVAGDEAWHATRETWGRRIPSDFAGALDAVAALKAKDKLDLLALCVGGCVSWHEKSMNHFDRAHVARQDVAAIAAFAGIDFADAWTPDADWLKRGSKGALQHGLAACGQRPKDGKRADLAAALAREAGKARWLPAPLASLMPPPQAQNEDEPEADPARMAAE